VVAVGVSTGDTFAIFLSETILARIADTRRLCVAVIAVLVLARDTASSLVVESITINALQYEEIYIEIASPSVYTYIKIRFLSFKQVTG